MDGPAEASVEEHGQSGVEGAPRPAPSSGRTPAAERRLRPSSTPEKHHFRRRGAATGRAGNSGAAGAIKARANQGPDMEIERFQSVSKMGEGCGVRSSVANGLIYPE